ncbi:MAG: GH92 family glycosyl hydrolase [Candidatus Hydrogenedentes bacterium]|nr:GH92 family glycosyl hydrolase [Candidatus Hydrogenedentota bacterium]
MKFRRVLKWVLIPVLALLAIPVLGLAFVWGAYRVTVAAKPGGLDTGIAPGALGAEVDPFIATGGVSWMCGHNSPAATVPFGMVRLAPDTASLFTNQQGLNRSGYFYGDNKILGFSHTRLLGADALEGGVFRILPATEPLAGGAPEDERFARFSHRQETAFPGYYAVRLPRDNILAELTATARTGVHRYTFPPGATPHLMLDATSTIADRRSERGRITIHPDRRRVEGSVRIFGSFSGRYGGLDVYFVAEFSAPFESYGVWSGNVFQPGERAAEGDSAGADLGFAASDSAQAVEVRLALSYVSVENARENLDAEALGKSFESIYAEARDRWEERLGRIRIEGGTESQRRIFYTALYRAFQMPTTFNDVNGEYTGFDKAVHTVEEGATYYTDMSLWDSFRTVHPLYNLIARGDQRDMMASLVAMGKAGGSLPRWPSGAGYTNCMFGTPADIAVSEAWLKGVRDFDIEAAYEMMRRTATTGPPEGTRFRGREGLAEYRAHGYCPSDVMSESVSATLEYAWCDHALSLLAADLGRAEDAALFAKGAHAYRNLWDPDRQFFVPRDSTGSFAEVFDPLVLSYTDSGRKYTRDFVEGSPMMWRWAVPFDGEGLVALFPNPEKFVAELEDYLKKSNRGAGKWHPGVHYWHGNEPYFHAAYLFNAAGRPDLTGKWVRHILETKYTDDYVGLDGNDDGGTMSAWYVFSALGFYPIAGTPRYEIGAPLFPRAAIDLGNGSELVVIAENAGPENPFVQSIHLNGKHLLETHLMHDAIADGGELRFKMGPRPGAIPKSDAPQ